MSHSLPLWRLSGWRIVSLTMFTMYFVDHCSFTALNYYLFVYVELLLLLFNAGKIEKREKLANAMLIVRSLRLSVYVCVFVCGCVYVQVTSAINHKPQCPCSSNTYHGNQCRGQVEQSYPAPENTTAANKDGRIIHTSTTRLSHPIDSPRIMCVRVHVSECIHGQKHKCQRSCAHSSCRYLHWDWPGDTMRPGDELCILVGFC